MNGSDNMKNGVKMSLAIIGVFLIVCEFFYGIPFLGSFIAFLPVIGMVIHWILFFLMIFFVFIVLVAPTYIPNKNARVVYTQYKERIKEDND